jgi:hypothetical protein
MVRFAHADVADDAISGFNFAGGNRIEEIAERKFSLLKPGARPEELLLTSADLRRVR